MRLCLNATKAHTQALQPTRFFHVSVHVCRVPPPLIRPGGHSDPPDANPHDVHRPTYLLQQRLPLLLLSWPRQGGRYVSQHLPSASNTALQTLAHAERCSKQRTDSYSSDSSALASSQRKSCAPVSSYACMPALLLVRGRRRRGRCWLHTQSGIDPGRGLKVCQPTFGWRLIEGFASERRSMTLEDCVGKWMHSESFRRG
jgi:hypothetical protein